MTESLPSSSRRDFAQLAASKSTFDALIKQLEAAQPVDALALPAAVSSHLLDRSQLDDLIQEHNEIADGILRLQVGDLEQLRADAKETAVATKEMSQEDTDVVELALLTLSTLDSGRMLLRQRSRSLNLMELRLKWQDQKTAVEKEETSLFADIVKYVCKARWILPQDAVTRRRRISMQAKKKNDSHINSPVSRQLDGFLAPSAEPASPLGGGSTSSIMARRMRLDILNLDLARHTQRLHSLDTVALAACGKTLDKIIDASPAKLPDEFLDIQEALEDKVARVVDKMQPFLAALVAQWKMADETYWLSEEIDQDMECLKRQIQADLLKRPSHGDAVFYQSRCDELSQKISAAREEVTQKLPLPAHKLMTDQNEANQQLKSLLLSCLDKTLESLNRLDDLSKQYTQAASAIERGENAKAAMEASLAALVTITQALQRLQGHLTAYDMHIFTWKPDPAFQDTLNKLKREMTAEVANAASCLQEAAACLAQLQKCHVDAIIRDEIRDMAKRTAGSQKECEDASRRLTDQLKVVTALHQHFECAQSQHSLITQQFADLITNFKRVRWKGDVSTSMPLYAQGDSADIERASRQLKRSLQDMRMMQADISDLEKLESHAKRSTAIVSQLQGLSLLCEEASKQRLATEAIVEYGNLLLRDMKGVMDGQTSYDGFWQRLEYLQSQSSLVPFLGTAFDALQDFNIPRLTDDLQFEEGQVAGPVLGSNPDADVRDALNGLNMQANNAFAVLQDQTWREQARAWLDLLRQADDELTTRLDAAATLHGRIKAIADSETDDSQLDSLVEDCERFVEGETVARPGQHARIMLLGDRLRALPKVSSDALLAEERQMSQKLNALQASHEDFFQQTSELQSLLASIGQGHADRVKIKREREIEEAESRARVEAESKKQALAEARQLVAVSLEAFNTSLKEWEEAIAQVDRMSGVADQDLHYDTTTLEAAIDNYNEQSPVLKGRCRLDLEGYSQARESLAKLNSLSDNEYNAEPPSDADPILEMRGHLDTLQSQSAEALRRGSDVIMTYKRAQEATAEANGKRLAFNECLEKGQTLLHEVKLRLTEIASDQSRVNSTKCEDLKELRLCIADFEARAELVSKCIAHVSQLRSIQASASDICQIDQERELESFSQSVQDVDKLSFIHREEVAAHTAELRSRQKRVEEAAAQAAEKAKREKDAQMQVLAQQEAALQVMQAKAEELESLTQTLADDQQYAINLDVTPEREASLQSFRSNAGDLRNRLEDLQLAVKGFSPKISDKANGSPLLQQFHSSQETLAQIAGMVKGIVKQVEALESDAQAKDDLRAQHRRDERSRQMLEAIQALTQEMKNRVEGGAMPTTRDATAFTTATDSIEAQVSVHLSDVGHSEVEKELSNALEAMRAKLNIFLKLASLHQDSADCERLLAQLLVEVEDGSSFGEPIDERNKWAFETRYSSGAAQAQAILEKASRLPYTNTRRHCKYFRQTTSDLLDSIKSALLDETASLEADSEPAPPTPTPMPRSTSKGSLRSHLDLDDSSRQSRIPRPSLQANSFARPTSSLSARSATTQRSVSTFAGDAAARMRKKSGLGLRKPSSVATLARRSPPTASQPTAEQQLYIPTKRKIDIAISRIVNELVAEGIQQIQLHAAGDAFDLTGKYWIGGRVYFCRILRDRTVMVRIGGGWQELRSFLQNHTASNAESSTALSRSSSSQTSLSMALARSTSGQSLARTLSASFRSTSPLDGEQESIADDDLLKLLHRDSVKSSPPIACRWH